MAQVSLKLVLNKTKSLDLQLPDFQIILKIWLKNFKFHLKNLVSYTENMDVFHWFEIRTRYLARYIVRVNFIKISLMKYHERVNPKNGMFF